MDGRTLKERLTEQLEELVVNLSTLKGMKMEVQGEEARILAVSITNLETSMLWLKELLNAL